MANKYKVLGVGKAGRNFKYSYKNKTHYYYPDLIVEKNGEFYYVEVKSTYTSGLHGVTTKDGKTSFSDLRRKAKAVIDSKENYMLLIMSEKGELLSKTVGLPNKFLLKTRLGL